MASTWIDIVVDYVYADPTYEYTKDSQAFDSMATAMSQAIQKYSDSKVILPVRRTLDEIMEGMPKIMIWDRKFSFTSYYGRISVCWKES